MRCNSAWGHLRLAGQSLCCRGTVISVSSHVRSSSLTTANDWPGSDGRVIVCVIKILGSDSVRNGRKFYRLLYILFVSFSMFIGNLSIIALHFNPNTVTVTATLTFCLIIVLCILQATGQTGQRVHLATRSFSASVAAGIATFLPGREVQARAVDAADRWFDTLNSRVPYADKKERSGYGVSPEVKAVQDAALNGFCAIILEAQNVTAKQPLGLSISCRSKDASCAALHLCKACTQICSGPIKTFATSSQATSARTVSRMGFRSCALFAARTPTLTP